MKSIALTQGKHALVDDRDFERVSEFKWYYHKSRTDRIGYAIRNHYYFENGTRKRGRMGMHWFILNAVPGTIDHKNRNGLDNRRQNLRTATATQNVINRNSNPRKVVFAGKGVTRVRDRNGIPAYWIARIAVSGKRFYLGTFSSQEKAETAYRNAAVKLHGEFACSI